MGSVDDDQTPCDDDQTPWFAELVEERGYNPFDVAAEIGVEIILATKAVVEILHENLQYIPRSDT